MDLSKLLRPPSLTDQVFQILLDRIYNGTYPPGAKLPIESELIKEFSISRVTLRNAYAKLEEHRLIQRRQGTGTYVTGQLNITNPRYQVMDFDDWIAKQGYTPGFKQLDGKIVATGADIACKLDIDTDSLSLRLEKIWTADGQPIIYNISHICLWVFNGNFIQDEITQPGLTEPFFLFLKQSCNVHVDYLTSCIYPEMINHRDLPEVFTAIATNTPGLVVEDVGFTVEGRPVFHSIGHFLGKASKIETLRRVY
jgi:GntR family transcriptional regulator